LGHEVVAVDNFYTGRRKNVEGFFGDSNFSLKEHDVSEPYEIDCDGIFNLACPASPLQYQKNPIYTVKTNFLGALNALNLGLKSGVPVLQASTSEVYGDPAENPQKETYWGNVNPVGIRACYDEGKRIAETLFTDHHRKYGLSIRLPRIFNTYGPKMDVGDGRVISNFIVQALRNEPLTVYGDGSQTRSFCFVEDLIDGFISLFFESNIQTPVNLGNPTPIAMLDLANKIIDLTASNSIIKYMPIPEDDPKLRMPDISIAHKELGWLPKTDLDKGLQISLEYFQNEIHKST
jgi:UDP-glucuronate decarboxylase